VAWFANGLAASISVIYRMCSSMVFHGTSFRQPDMSASHYGAPPALSKLLWAFGAEISPQVAELKPAVPRAVSALRQGRELW